MKWIDYRDELFDDLHKAVMRWRKEAGSDFTLAHPGIVPHSINSVKRRIPVSDFVKLYVEGDEIQAFFIAQGAYHGFDAFISPAISKSAMQDILQAAYRDTRQQMDELERKEYPVNTDVFGVDRMRQEILQELGFERGDNWQNLMRRDLNEPIDEPELPEGFVIRPSTMDDYEQLAAVHSGAFGSDWNPEVYRDEIMNRPGYAPEREMVVLAPDGRFAAFCVYWLDELNRVGLFEPVGAHSDFQRKGLTRALMNHTLSLMKTQGMQEAEIGHETDNPASTNLYSSVGFKFYQQVFRYSKA